MSLPIAYEVAFADATFHAALTYLTYRYGVAASGPWAVVLDGRMVDSARSATIALRVAQSHPGAEVMPQCLFAESLRGAAC